MNVRKGQATRLGQEVVLVVLLPCAGVRIAGWGLTAGNCLCAGQDQTRGWFYTLMVLSTALFNKPAFKNLVCNGLVLADDGKKMSKRLKNYPVSLPKIHLVS